MSVALSASTPAQRQATHVLRELADRIDAALTRPVLTDQAVSDGSLVVRHFLRELCLVTGRLSERSVHLSQRIDLLAESEHDSAPLPALLDEIDRKTWHLLVQVESFLSKRFGSPYFELRPYVAALGEKTLAEVRDLYRRLASVQGDPAAQVDVVALAMRIKRDLNTESERLLQRIELLEAGNRINPSDKLGPVPRLSPKPPLPRSPRADTEALNLWPVLGYTLSGLALVVAVYHYWPVFLVLGLVLLGLAVIGLIFKHPWAFIIAMLLGRD